MSRVTDGRTAPRRADAIHVVRLPLGEEDIRPTFRRERAALKRGVWPVAGCDEAGRGPLAGPVVAAAVILDPKRVPRGLDDSKKLDAETREKLYAKICGSAATARASAHSDARRMLSRSMREGGANATATSALAQILA